MSVETNKAIVHRCWEEAWNRNNLTVLKELWSPDNVHHFGASSERFGPDQFATMVKVWRAAIPDYNCHIEELVAERDLVVMRLRFVGTHTSASLTISGRTAMPRNRSFNETEILMFRMQEGKVVESWATWDRLSFLDQLGAIDQPSSV
jgi:predicted ester cyclase